MNSIAMQDLESGCRKTGQAFFSKMAKSDQNLVRFGMFPMTVVTAFENEIREKIATEYAKANFLEADKTGITNLAKTLKDSIINALSKEFCIGLMDGAKSDGGMVA